VAPCERDARALILVRLLQETCASQLEFVEIADRPAASIAAAAPTVSTIESSSWDGERQDGK
jgi:hypothetical protein